MCAVACALACSDGVSRPAQAATSLRPARAAATNAPRVLGAYEKLPLAFEANRGQTDPRVKFFSRGPGYTVFLTSNETVLAFERPASALRMSLVGGKAAPAVAGLDELPGKSNYFTGKDAARWHTNIPTYAKVRYQDVYPGIDLVYYGHRRQLEYDFVVAPGADPDSITLRFDGASAQHIDDNGDLVMQTDAGEVRFRKPVVYQPGSGSAAQLSVDGRYVQKGRNQVRFDIGDYDRTKPLVIDPVLSYSTYFGGNHDDISTEIAVDGAGHAYITGSTNSTANFPLVNAAQSSKQGAEYSTDAFVAAFNPTDGALLYSTYLGGGGDDEALGIAADEAGRVYVAGRTRSTDFPVLNPFQAASGGGIDAFVTAFDQTGMPFYSTYLGAGDSDYASGIAVDAAGVAYVTGATESDDFPTVNAWQATNAGQGDSFVAAFDSAGGALLYATYLGGASGDYAKAIAADRAGRVYVTGYTSSTDFPTVNALQPAHVGSIGVTDVFVAALDASGGMLYATYLGGAGDEWGTGIAVDTAGSAYVTGWTISSDFPLMNAFQPAHGGALHDAFVAALDPSGSSLLYSTYLGGSDDDSAAKVAVDGAGNAWVIGSTRSTDFPTANPLQPSNHGGPVQWYSEPVRPHPGTDVFVAAFDHTGSLANSTYLGGADYDFGAAIAVDGSGNTYVTGYTVSTDFPTVNSLQSKNTEIDPDHPSKNWDTFVAVLTSEASPPTGCAAPPTITPLGGTFNEPLAATLSTTTSDATIYYTTDGSTPTNASLIYDGPIAITQTTTLQAIATASGLTDSGVSSATFTLQAAPPTFDPPGGLYGGPQWVSLSDASPGVTIYYTRDGSIPTTASTAYTGPIVIASTTTIRAMAVAQGWSQSQVVFATYEIRAASPVFSPVAGTYDQPQSVVLSTTTSGATIYYSTDGSAPGWWTGVYSQPIAVTRTTTIRARAVASGFAESDVSSATFTLQAAPPTFSPPGGSYLLPQRVSISDASPGTTIYYTTDGSTPTISSTQYTGPILILRTTTLRAIAVAPGWTPSLVATGTYQMPLP
jgi:chitobiase/beta-hexosaminidase-like protein/beta-propeller repeat-containing protein